ncbi:hypothetical protein GCM10007853_12070 [Algimonas ampicilliniresistens]|uniref:Uncharacterized protein n=1 Tax=Algimonas ampicilliniresistens TaxID=1298735 RepID=A0ABQ5V909_9PROT|nr:hypothetical protein GCM10007853_12070 [Algimonas ampicilliniresistens]
MASVSIALSEYESSASSSLAAAVVESHNTFNIGNMARPLSVKQIRLLRWSRAGRVSTKP